MARAYEYITKYTSPNQNARKSKITGLTIHWWGNPAGQKIEGIVSWLCDKRAGTSAHYVVSDGIVYCIVDPDRRAWHAGNSAANHSQIGIELDPNASKRAGTMRTAAALIADLRKTYGNLPLSPHKRWTSTA
ncbi:TPA: N-acetylmuramoyl-L-alanine amidase, partial [Shigella flexneri]|nr:N-acetylmuramoyl-L-alanine amidase [Shigella flexneri]